MNRKRYQMGGNLKEYMLRFADKDALMYDYRNKGLQEGYPDINLLQKGGFTGVFDKRFNNKGYEYDKEHYKKRLPYAGEKTVPGISEYWNTVDGKKHKEYIENKGMYITPNGEIQPKNTVTSFLRNNHTNNKALGFFTGQDNYNWIADVLEKPNSFSRYTEGSLATATAIPFNPFTRGKTISKGVKELPEFFFKETPEVINLVKNAALSLPNTQLKSAGKWLEQGVDHVVGDAVEHVMNTQEDIKSSIEPPKKVYSPKPRTTELSDKYNIKLDTRYQSQDMMQKGGNIARTPDDFSTGILKGKTVFPFGTPGPKTMTMNTPKGQVPYPIEYKGFTNNKLTDYGIALPGQDFVVEGDTVVENKLYDSNSYMKPNKYMLKGGRFYKVGGFFQKGGYTDPTLEGLQEHLRQSNENASQYNMSDVERPRFTRMDPNQENKFRQHFGEDYEDLSKSLNESQLQDMMGSQVQVDANTNRDLKEHFGPEFEELLQSYSMEELRIMMEDNLLNMGQATPDRNTQHIPPAPGTAPTVLPNTSSDFNRSAIAYSNEFIPPAHAFTTSTKTDAEYEAYRNNPNTYRTELTPDGEQLFATRSEFDVTFPDDDYNVNVDNTKGRVTNEKFAGRDVSGKNLAGNFEAVGYTMSNNQNVLKPEISSALDKTVGSFYTTDVFDPTNGFNSTTTPLYKNIYDNVNAASPGFINNMDNVITGLKDMGVTTREGINNYLNSTAPGDSRTVAENIKATYGLNYNDIAQYLSDGVSNSDESQTRFKGFNTALRTRADINGLAQMAVNRNNILRNKDGLQDETSRGMADNQRQTTIKMLDRYANYSDVNNGRVVAANGVHALTTELSRLGAGNPNNPLNTAAQSLRAIIPTLTPEELQQITVTDPNTGVRTVDPNAENRMKFDKAEQTIMNSITPGNYRDFKVHFNNDVLEPIVSEHARVQSQLRNLSNRLKNATDDNVRRSIETQMQPLENQLNSLTKSLLYANGIGSKVEKRVMNDNRFSNDPYVKGRKEALQSRNQDWQAGRTNNTAGGNNDNEFVNQTLRDITNEYDLAIATYGPKLATSGNNFRGLYFDNEMDNYGQQFDPTVVMSRVGQSRRTDNLQAQRFNPTPGNTKPPTPPTPRVGTGTGTSTPKPPTQSSPTIKRPVASQGTFQGSTDPRRGGTVNTTTDNTRKTSRREDAGGTTQRGNRSGLPSHQSSGTSPFRPNPNTPVNRQTGGYTPTYKIGQPISYREGGQIKTGIVKRYNPFNGDIELM